jgi:hypothetical protein
MAHKRIKLGECITDRTVAEDDPDFMIGAAQARTEGEARPATCNPSTPDIARLIEAAEKVCVRRPNTVIRIAAHTNLTQYEDSDKAVKEGRS